MLVNPDGSPLIPGQKVPAPSDLTKQSPATFYEPASYYSGFVPLSNRPPFTAATVAQMLTDPRVVYGLWLLKGPIITNAHVYVKCNNEIIRQYVIEQINRFWMNSAMRALKAIEWGYYGAEVMYREVKGQIHFDTLRDFQPPDVKLKTYLGRPLGIVVRNVKGANQPVFLGFPKAFYHVHWRDRNPWYGLSRLFGAHVPWWEIWSDGGYRDIRRLWFYKNAYEGGTIRHPPGSSRDEHGILRPHKEMAREMVDKKRTGGTLTLPNTPGGGADGQGYAWDYEPPVANPAPEGLLEYGETLREEIFEALGIPPEVIQSGGDQGFGSSTGRQVPQMAFYSILQELFQWLLTDLMDYLLTPLLTIVFGQGYEEVTLMPFNLGEDLSSGGSPGDNGMEQGTGEFNGNQFEDENQRAVFMAVMSAMKQQRKPPRYVRRYGRWWLLSDTGDVTPMSMAI